MPVESPYPELDELISAIGEAGQRLSEIEASEERLEIFRCSWAGRLNAPRFPL